jgi:hypothetical protein
MSCDNFQLPILIATVKSRLAVNAVTMGNFNEPIRISLFVKDLFAGFSVVWATHYGAQVSDFVMFQLNLKNDILRRRFDSLKYDMKKIEEGQSVYTSSPRSVSCDLFSWSVVYDVTLRKLASPIIPQKASAETQPT